MLTALVLLPHVSPEAWSEGVPAGDALLYIDFPTLVLLFSIDWAPLNSPSGKPVLPQESSCIPIGPLLI